MVNAEARTARVPTKEVRMIGRVETLRDLRKLDVFLKITSHNEGVFMCLESV